jgi:hypothetical protein
MKMLARRTAGEQRIAPPRTVNEGKRIDIETAPFDTEGSALTGRPLPAAREYSHLLVSERCALGTFFQPGIQRGTGDS